MKQTKQSQWGFTVVELVIVVAITALIATLILANFRAGENQKRVNIALDTVISALSTAQDAALTGKSTTNTNSNCRIPKYYFLDFTYSASFTLYAQNNCDTTDLIGTYNLPANTRIKNNALILDFTGNSSLAANTDLKIAFYPPFASVKGLLDSGSFSSFVTSSITVETMDGSINKTVPVNGLLGKIGQ